MKLGKIPDNSKYITNREFKKMTGESFPARLKQTDLVNKTHFHDT